METTESQRAAARPPGPPERPAVVFALLLAAAIVLMRIALPAADAGAAIDPGPSAGRYGWHWRSCRSPGSSSCGSWAPCATHRGRGGQVRRHRLPGQRSALRRDPLRRRRGGGTVLDADARPPASAATSPTRCSRRTACGWPPSSSSRPRPSGAGSGSSRGRSSCWATVAGLVAARGRVRVSPGPSWSSRPGPWSSASTSCEPALPRTVPPRPPSGPDAHPGTGADRGYGRPATTGSRELTGPRRGPDPCMRLVVDLNRCQGYAQCAFLAPDVFTMHGDEALLYDPEPDDDAARAGRCGRRPPARSRPSSSMRVDEPTRRGSARGRAARRDGP